VSLYIWIIVFVVSLFVLVKASNFFVFGAENIGLALGMPPFVVGVVIVAVGTSLPELVSSIVSVTAGNTEIVVGNVLGSNIANIMLVLGLAGVFCREFKIYYDLMKVDVPFLLGSAFLLAFMLLDGKFTPVESIILLACLVLYLINSLKAGKGDAAGEKVKAGWKHWLALVLSPVFIFLGAKFTIDAVLGISAIAGIATEVIALSAVALGTSLPEVFVTVSAVRSGKAELAVGNIIGSNIFNTFVVMGIPGLIKTLVVPASIIRFSMPVSVAAVIICFVFIFEKRMNRFQGGFLLAFYIFFIGKLYNIL
jgi:cation:H+ antiporter